MSNHVSGAVKCDAKKITSLAAIMIKPSLLGNELQWLSVTACHTETRLVTPPMSVCVSSLSDFDVVITYGGKANFNKCSPFLALKVTQHTA